MSHWCGDGRFKSVPNKYIQIFTSHGFEGDKLIPLVYCLLSSKTRAIYSQVFLSLKNKADILSVILMPTLFTCYFESDLISSVWTEFPTTHIRGCHFHFCQATYRRVQLLGLSTINIHHEGHRIYIRKPLAIALIPVDLVAQTFDYLNSIVLLNRRAFLNTLRTNSG